MSYKIPRYNEEERKQLVVDMVEGKLYACDTEDKLRLGYQYLILNSMMGKMSKKERGNIGLVLGVWSSVGPRACNNIPSFGTIQIIHKDDSKHILEEYNKKIITIKQVIKS